MENENIKQPQSPVEQPQKMTTPMAIVVAGVLILIGILLTNGVGGGKKVVVEKTLSEQVGVAKDKFAECVKGFDVNAYSTKILASVESATKGETGVGTPYSIVIGSNGIKSKMVGALPYEEAKKIIDEVIAGKVTTPYTGDVPPVDPATDHIIGNPATATVTIVEYSDFECPYCARFHPVLEQIVSESNGTIAWVYRPFPLTQIHQHAMERAVAAECVAQIKGNDAYWKYADLLFGLLNPAPDPVTSQL